MEDIIKKINESSIIGITYHVSPDGDAVGSALALLQGIRKLGKISYILSKDVISEDLGFLPCSSEIDNEVYEPKDDTDLVIILDCGNLERVSAELGNYKGTTVNIDHHLSNDKYAQINYVDTNASATAEIVYSLLKAMNVIVNKDMATCLYTSIVTDTGSFRHSNVTKRTHEIAGELISLGINNSVVHSELFDNKPIESLILLGEVIKNIRTYFNGKVSVLEITNRICDSIGIPPEEVADVVNFGLQVKGVEVAVLLKEASNGIKVSLRSKNNFDVRNIAGLFGGGGHSKASGVFFKEKSIDEAKELLLSAIEKELI